MVVYNLPLPAERPEKHLPHTTTDLKIPGVPSTILISRKTTPLAQQPPITKLPTRLPKSNIIYSGGLVTGH